MNISASNHLFENFVYSPLITLYQNLIEHNLKGLFEKLFLYKLKFIMVTEAGIITLKKLVEVVSAIIENRKVKSYVPLGHQGCLCQICGSCLLRQLFVLVL